MTPRMMSRAAPAELADRWNARARELCFFKAEASDPLVRRMDKIDSFSEFDRCEDGLIRNRAGVIDGNRVVAQVQTLNAELLITFLGLGRVLIGQDGTYFADNDGTAGELTPQDTLYGACDALWTARAS